MNEEATQDNSDGAGAKAIDEASFNAGTERERARCRRIVEKIFGRDWSGNDALALIDSGEWP